MARIYHVYIIERPKENTLQFKQLIETKNYDEAQQVYDNYASLYMDKGRYVSFTSYDDSIDPVDDETQDAFGATIIEHARSDEEI